MKKYLFVLLLCCVCGQSALVMAAETSGKIENAKFLISEVDKNQMRFDKNYKDKRIIVEGFVGNIKEKNGGYTLWLYGESNPSSPKFIECRFSLEAEDSLLELNKRDLVKIEGFYKGEEQFQLGSLVLHDCAVK